MYAILKNNSEKNTEKKKLSGIELVTSAIRIQRSNHLCYKVTTGGASHFLFVRSELYSTMIIKTEFTLRFKLILKKH